MRADLRSLHLWIVYLLATMLHIVTPIAVFALAPPSKTEELLEELRQQEATARQELIDRIWDSRNWISFEKTYLLMRDIQPGHRILYVGAGGTGVDYMVLEASLGAQVLGIDNDPQEFRELQEQIPDLTKRYPSMQNTSGTITLRDWDVHDLAQHVASGDLPPHSFDHVTMTQVGLLDSFVEHFLQRLSGSKLFQTAEFDWDKVASNLLLLLKGDGGTLLFRFTEMKEIAPRIKKLGIAHTVIPLEEAIANTGNPAIDNPYYLIVLGNNPEAQLTPYAKECLAKTEPVLTQPSRHQDLASNTLLPGNDRHDEDIPKISPRAISSIEQSL